jgi:hypothetical protein
MTGKLLTLGSLVAALTTLSLVAATTGSAASKHPKRQRHPPRAVVLPPPPLSGQRSEPRMIEARPGIWVSTWDHIIDEGQGRWMVESREP